MLVMTLARYRRRTSPLAVLVHENVNAFGSQAISLVSPPLVLTQTVFDNLNQFGAMAIAPVSQPLVVVPAVFTNSNQFGAQEIENVTPIVTSYANTGGTGNRTAIITATHDGSLFAGGTAPRMVDGVTSGTFDMWFNASGGHYLKFDFGTPVVIDTFKWFQGNNANHGMWQWYGSNDNSSYTALGSSFTLDGGIGNTPKEHAQPAGNTAAYRYYRLTQLSGNCSASPDIYEIQFKIYGL